jgi:uncharacterized membrane protein/Mg-chelatase subunit ChlD
MTISFTDPIYLWALLLIPLTLGLAALAPRALPSFRRRLSLVLRTLVLALVIFALAGAQLRRPVDNLTVVFLVDVSDSMPAGARQEAAGYVREAIESMPAGDKAAVVLFGRDALVERTASELRRLDPLSSVPVATRTNVADAIQLGLALLPGDTQKRLVLISDGQQNEGDARAAADLAAAREVVLDTVSLGGATSGPEVQLSALDAPNSVREGQRFELSVRLDANQDTSVRLRVFGDSQLLYDEQVEVPEGGTSYRVPLEADEAGFRRYRAVIDAPAGTDTRPQNNEAASFTQVEGPPLVAVVTSDPDEAAPLVAALEASEMRVDVLAPGELPQSLPELRSYDSVILVNVQAPELPASAMDLLPTYVRDLGHGLVMVGGPESYGAGQWLRTPVEEALPVDMEVQPRDQQANIALVLAVDKSGSMGRCHCNDPNNPQERQDRNVSGLPKVDIAKDAVVQATAALGQMDFVGVVAFDSAARQVLETQRFPGLPAMEQAIGPIEANGQTNIFAGLTTAGESLEGVDARVKHIILLTDGWSRAGDFQQLADDFAEQGITLSVVAAGAGSSPDLEALALAGGGQFYSSVTMEDVPQIFLRETVRIAGRYIIEEPFYPTLMSTRSTILSGLPLDEVPPLVGYNGSTLKADASELMRTSRGDPLLATRRYGLGRTVAWTSDLSGRWAGDWLGWNGFPDFAAQMVAWSFPEPQSGDLQLRTRQEGSATYLDVTATNEQGLPVNAAETRANVTGPDGESTELSIPQVGAGQYRVELPADNIGAYFVTVRQLDEEGEVIGGASRGVVVPYSPEYRLQQVDEALLQEVAARTNGEVRTLDDPTAVFEHPPQRVTRAQDLWPWLLAFALLLFPFDVAVRRVMFGRREWESARAWVAARTSRRPAAPREEPALGSLMEAKQRATRRDSLMGDPADEGTSPIPGVATRPTSPTPRPATPPSIAPQATPTAPPASDTTPADTDADEGDTLSRLRQAKRRTRR